MHSSSERTGTDFSAAKHQSHQPSSSIFSSEAGGEFFRFLQPTSQLIFIEGDISPSLADPTLLSVVGVVDGQFTGFITKERRNFINTSTERTGPGFKSISRPASSKERDLWRHIQSANRVSFRPNHEAGHVMYWLGHEVYHVIHRRRRSEVHSLHSRPL